MWVALAILLLVSISAMGYLLAAAPEGYEDETGFHAANRSTPKVRPSAASIPDSESPGDHDPGELAHST
jgi:hypothetical protein